MQEKGRNFSEMFILKKCYKIRQLLRGTEITFYGTGQRFSTKGIYIR